MQRNIFIDPLSVHFPFRSDVRNIYFFTIDTADTFSITFLQNDAKDNFVNAHNHLALSAFGPFSILKNTHVVLKLWRIFGLKDRRNILSQTTTFDFSCIGCNSKALFKTCPTQCTIHIRVFTLGFLWNCIWVCEFLRSYSMSDWDRRNRKGHQIMHGLI